MKRINLGSGNQIYPDFINVDKIAGKGVDIVWNLDILPYPFDTNSIDEVCIFSVLEHLELSIYDFLKEMKRILKSDGILNIRVPLGAQALGMFHKRFFSIGDFGVNANDNEQRQLCEGWDIKKKIGFHKCGKTWFFNRIVEWIVNRIRVDLYDFSCLRYLFPANEMIITMKRKV